MVCISDIEKYLFPQNYVESNMQKRREHAFLWWYDYKQRFFFLIILSLKDMYFFFN